MLLVISLVFAVVLFSGCNGQQEAEAAAEKPAAKAVQGGTELTTSGESIKWSMFTAYGPEDGACCEIWPVLFDEIRERTNGQLDIQVFWSGQHPYEGSDMLKVLRDGEAEMAHLYSGFLTSVEPVLGLDGIPMLLPPETMEAYRVVSTLWGNFEQDTSGTLERVLQERWGASMIHLLPASPQRFFTKGYAVEGLGSLEGHKVRVYSPELADLVKILGGTPVSLSFGEVYTGLATGLIDGLVTSLQFAKSGGFLEVCDTINMWEIMAGMDGTAVSLKALEELPADIRNIFLDVMRTSAKKPETLELTNNAMILENELLNGNRAYVPDPDKREEVYKRVKREIVDNWIEQVGDDAVAVIDQIEKLK